MLRTAGALLLLTAVSLAASVQKETVELSGASGRKAPAGPSSAGPAEKPAEEPAIEKSVSPESKTSRESAPDAPVGMLTTGHLLSCSWLTDRQSISPSVMTSILPPSRHRCWPNRPQPFMSPTTVKDLSAKRSFCAFSWPSGVQ